ncbi:MAG: GNAT family N-acetyltransferase [Casimicrobiaceae bacterium]
MISAFVAHPADRLAEYFDVATIDALRASTARRRRVNRRARADLCDDSAFMSETNPVAPSSPSVAAAHGSGATVQQLSATQIRDAISELVALLQDAIDGNASVGFVRPVAEGELEAFWHEVALDVDDGLRSLLVSRCDGAIAGSVILALAMKSNQRHRAEVQKLLVRRDARRRGLATALMQQVEELALRSGRWLLTLDTRSDSGAAKLYRGRGYVEAGAIPDYASDPDRQLASCTFFFKPLRGSR